MKKEVWMFELGNFDERQVKRIAAKMDGATFYNFRVIYSNLHGNCQIGVEVESEDPDNEIKEMFIHTAFNMI